MIFLFEKRLILGNSRKRPRAFSNQEEGRTTGRGSRNRRFYLEAFNDFSFASKTKSKEERGGGKLEGCRVSKGEKFPRRERELVPVIRWLTDRAKMATKDGLFLMADANQPPPPLPTFFHLLTNYLSPTLPSEKKITLPRNFNHPIPTF